MEKKLRYKRVLLKLSGEVLAGDGTAGKNFDSATVREVCEAIRRCTADGIEVAVVVGGGNLIRGANAGALMGSRERADYLGMLGTVMNGLVLADALETIGVEARVVSAVNLDRVAEPYERGRVLRHLERGRVVIFTFGTGHPYFSTDTTAVLRAIEIGADLLLFAKNVDGVYDRDPNGLDAARAVRLDSVSYNDIIKAELNVIDRTAAALGSVNGLKTRIFGMVPPERIYDAATGADVGTLVY